MAVILLLDTSIEMQSALGTSAAITGVTSTNPVVVTSANSFSGGEIVVLKAPGGLVELDNLQVRVANPTGTTFECEGLDGTALGTYTSGGTVEEVTTFTAFNNATSFNFPEPNPNRIDVTTINRTTKVEVFGLDDAPQITIPMNASPLDPHVLEMRKASLSKTDRVFRVTLQNGNVLIFNGGVAGGRGLDGSVGAVATASCSVTLSANEQWFVS